MNYFIIKRHPFESLTIPTVLSSQLPDAQSDSESDNGNCIPKKHALLRATERHKKSYFMSLPSCI